MNKYIKKYIRLFFVFFFFGLLIAYPSIDAKARNNAYIACFIDDAACMYKTEVLFSGTEIENKRIGFVIGEEATKNFVVTGDKRIPLYGAKMGNQESITNGDMSINTSSVELYPDGSVSLEFEGNGKSVGINQIHWYSVDVNENYVNIMTFPQNVEAEASSADINRAYSVQELLEDGFRDALLFINDGKAYTNVKNLRQAAYHLVCTKDGGTLTNQFGNTYTIMYDRNKEGQPEASVNGYVYYVRISKNSVVDGKTHEETTATRQFVWKVKKGYRNATNGELMENGVPNNLVLDENDTEYITWEHMFFQAGLLYSQGISYSNQADLYTMDAVESGITAMLRNMFTGLRSKLQLYSIEDCIFNNSIRGTSAFTFGVYHSSWNKNISLFFLVSASISLLFIGLAVIRLVLKKQAAAISPSAEFSVMEGCKDLLIAISFIIFTFPIIRLCMFLNYQFTGIWASLIGTKTLSGKGAEFSTLAGVIYQIAYFIISLAINFFYILRGLVIPLLIIVSPLCVISMVFGRQGKMIFSAWSKEFFGNLFVQAIHALVYGFILWSSAGLRGIESIVICTSILLLTSTLKHIFGMGGDAIMKKAEGLAKTSATIGTAAVGAGTQIAGNAVAGAGNFVGNAVNAATGGAVNVASGAVGAVAGAGSSVGSAVTSSMANISPGNLISGGANLMGGALKSVGGGVRMATGAAESLVFGDGSGDADIRMGAGAVADGLNLSSLGNLNRSQVGRQGNPMYAGGGYNGGDYGGGGYSGPTGGYQNSFSRPVNNNNIGRAGVVGNIRPTVTPRVPALSPENYSQAMNASIQRVKQMDLGRASGLGDMSRFPKPDNVEYSEYKNKDGRDGLGIVRVSTAFRFNESTSGEVANIRDMYRQAYSQDGNKRGKNVSELCKTLGVSSIQLSQDSSSLNGTLTFHNNLNQGYVRGKA